MCTARQNKTKRTTARGSVPIGLHRYGVVKVSSTTRGMPASFAIAASSSRGLISKAGLDTVSQKMHLVLSSIAALTASGSHMSTNLAVMPKLGRMSLNWCGQEGEGEETP